MSAASAGYRRIAMIAVAVLLFLGTVGVVGCAADEPAGPVTDPAPAPAPVPEPENGNESEIPDADTARVLVESKCSGCHMLDQVWAKTQDRAGWESPVARMEAQGLRVTDEERETIIDYLSNQ